MRELIDRAALIAEYDRVHVGEPGGARKLMEDAPTVVTEYDWIPCDMQLPENTQLCLVTEKTVVGFEVRPRCFIKRDDGGFWSGWGHTDVIAWRSLPSPYQEGEQE